MPVVNCCELLVTVWSSVIAVGEMNGVWTHAVVMVPGTAQPSVPNATAAVSAEAKANLQARVMR